VQLDGNIRDRQSRQLVTASELLSPTNKRTGLDRQQYLHKRQQHFHARVNLVATDLLRSGNVIAESDHLAQSGHQRNGIALKPPSSAAMYTPDSTMATINQLGEPTNTAKIRLVTTPIGYPAAGLAVPTFAASLHSLSNVGSIATVAKPTRNGLPSFRVSRTMEGIARAALADYQT
jgi:hypothetical protein